MSCEIPTSPPNAPVPTSLRNQFLFCSWWFHSRSISSLICCSSSLLTKIVPHPIPHPRPTKPWPYIPHGSLPLFWLLLSYHPLSELTPKCIALHFNPTSTPWTLYIYSLFFSTLGLNILLSIKMVLIIFMEVPCNIQWDCNQSFRQVTSLSFSSALIRIAKYLLYLYCKLCTCISCT